MKRNEYVGWLCDRLAPLGTISARAMFGGWSLYCDGLIFAIVVDEVCYLKADDETIPSHAAAGCGPFEYASKDGRINQMRYYRLPDESLEDDALLLQWSRGALGAALRAQAAKAGKGKGKPR